ncbi:hypothetical protein NDU88_010105 [Pleurodeles waltl]|uniref:Uncharacterized protein n=1 Tax=Pleurodeles waltl TaxID=8319 RepID=A0AAV7QX49_PLEWA|nr:hypothetical protein NDU88_010105 [Pleurodeles waltl]
MLSTEEAVPQGEEFISRRSLRFVMYCFVPPGPDTVLGLFFSITFGLYFVCLCEVEEVALHGGRCSAAPPLLALRGLPHCMPGLRAWPARSPVAGAFKGAEGLGQPDRHTGCHLAGFPPSVAPLVTPTHRLSATAGLVAVCLCASSSGPFSHLPVRATSRPRWGPGSYHPVPDASPGLAFGFRPRLRSRCVSDFNFTACSVGSSSFMRPPS